MIAGCDDDFVKIGVVLKRTNDVGLYGVATLSTTVQRTALVVRCLTPHIVIEGP